MMALPVGHAVACDSDFMTSRKFKIKIVKLKEATLEDREERTGKDKSLTHSRKLSGSGNNDLTKAFRGLRVKNPTENLKRALLQ